MSAASHTPGPWTSDNEVIPWRNGASPGVRVAFQSDECTTSPICIVDDRWGGFVAKANARLIAAAPELLEALKAYDRWNYEVQSARVNGESVYSYAELQEMREKAASLAYGAIAKATGETK